jgi:tetratricopeptide (TPR) repeat protein
LVQVRAVLKDAFEEGRTRSDYVTLLARAQNRLGEFDETARLLDSVRITVWEGSREAHDLFEEAHVALGKAQLEKGNSTAALIEFNRALEYPENLAIGKMENARETHIHYLRGNAFDALGQKAEAIKAWQLAANERESKDSKIEEARQKAKEALAKTDEK